MKNRPHLNSIWVTRFGEGKPYQTVEVDRELQRTVLIGMWPGNGKNGYKFRISRADAKLLARRIEQCLKATALK